MTKLSKNRLAFVIVGAIFLVVGLVGVLVSFLTTPKPFTLDSDQLGSSGFVDITGAEYESLVASQRSFLVFVDQAGCITADGLKKIAAEISEEKQLKVYHLFFSEARDTSLHNYVKYYPSFVIVHSGEVVDWLKADSDDDIERYKDKTELLSWLEKYLKF
ncbi:hypothetical protein IJF86_00855 [Candidatus Saccharibacteria bacterium]|nr:hypothetical protein [Candidatus Saccharibacteria bacterium]